MDLLPGEVVDRYTVEAVLGSGGVATVYRVRHNTLGSRQALKVIHLSEYAITERLVQEGRVQAALKHPNIVAVTDVVDIRGSPGLIMEFVDGPTLQDWLDAHQPDREQAESIFRGILAGVGRAHKLGLVHRDLKPGNVLLERAEDGSLVPKVADFGLAKILALDEQGLAQTRSGTTMGTPAYMAPEQVRDSKTVDQRADIFALGCILYELFVGRSPFDSADLLQIFASLASGEYRPPEELVPDLPVRIRNTIRGCLTTNRDERIGDCAMLREVLDGRVTDSWTGISDPGFAATVGSRLTGASQPGLQPGSKAADPGERVRLRASAVPTVLEAPSGGSRVSPVGLAVLGVGVLVGAGIVLVLVAGGIATALYVRPSADPPTAAAAPDPPPVAPVDPVAADVVPPVAPVEPASVDPIEAAPAAAGPKPKPTRATPPAAPAAPAGTGTVKLEGDADAVWLDGASGRAEVGAVAPGEYKVRAKFGGQADVAAGRIVVRAGQTTTIVCKAAFQMCQSR